MRKATRTVESVVHPRSECFDWLAGATGVELIVAAGHGVEAVRVAGELDTASIDAVENVLLDCLDRSPDRLELDISGVLFLDDAGRQMIGRAGEHARARGVALEIVRARAHRCSRRSRPAARS